MRIICVRDNENKTLKRKTKKNKDGKEQRSDANYSESVRAKWLCCAFKLGLLQLICKASVVINRVT